jgi:hypothetical protein
MQVSKYFMNVHVLFYLEDENSMDKESKNPTIEKQLEVQY